MVNYFISALIHFSYSKLKKRFSFRGCWRYKLPSRITPSTDKCQLITEQLDDADNPWAYEDLNDVAGDQTEVRTMLDEPSNLLTSTSSVDSETEPTFSVSHIHASRTAHTQFNAQGDTRGSWDPVYSHTGAVVELEMDVLTSEQQMSTSSV